MTKFSNIDHSGPKHVDYDQIKQKTLYEIGNMSDEELELFKRQTMESTEDE